jgi:hypothetical protein
MSEEKTKENSNTSSVLEHLKDYLQTHYDLAVLKVSDKGSSILSEIISYTILAIIGVFFLIFLSFGIALLISQAIGNAYSGFLIVAGFYLLVGIIIFASKEKMVKLPLLNMFIKSLHGGGNHHA